MFNKHHYTFVSMPKVHINRLVEEGIIDLEAAKRLNNAWINNCDELYSRMKVCIYVTNLDDAKSKMEVELGIKHGSFDGFMKYIEEYVSPEVVSAEKPKVYPLGYIVD